MRAAYRAITLKRPPDKADNPHGGNWLAVESAFRRKDAMSEPAWNLSQGTTTGSSPEHPVASEAPSAEAPNAADASGGSERVLKFKELARQHREGELTDEQFKEAKASLFEDARAVGTVETDDEISWGWVAPWLGCIALIVFKWDDYTRMLDMDGLKAGVIAGVILVGFALVMMRGNNSIVSVLGAYAAGVSALITLLLVLIIGGGIAYALFRVAYEMGGWQGLIIPSIALVLVVFARLGREDE